MTNSGKYQKNLIYERIDEDLLPITSALDTGNTKAILYKSITSSLIYLFFNECM
jgi:hypothetical protein